MIQKTKEPKRLFLLFTKKLFGKTRKQRIGSALIIFALAALFYTYYPLIQLFMPSEPYVVSSSSKITIPKIKVIAPITWSVDPFDKKEYREVLTRGVAHARGTAMPGNLGTAYIFAHSSDFPWRLTRYNVIFFRLDELIPGDEIIITKDKKNYKYRVREKKNVWPSKVYYLTESARTQLILQTCAPPGTAFMRLLIFADPV